MAQISANSSSEIIKLGGDVMRSNKMDVLKAGLILDLV